MPAHGAPAPEHALRMAPAGHSRDRRGSPVPTAGMIATKVMELRKRRGLMIALIAVNIGLPAVFLLIRLLGGGRPTGGHRRHSGSSSLVVTCRNHDSSEVWTGWSR